MYDILRLHFQQLSLSKQCRDGSRDSDCRLMNITETRNSQGGDVQPGLYIIITWGAFKT